MVANGDHRGMSGNALTSILERLSVLKLEDRWKRNFKYLRLSITDRCNYRCIYCLPDGYKNIHKSPEITLSEIGFLSDALADLGVEKIRITGGEPCLRRDLFAIAERIRCNPKIKTLALSTNAYSLERDAERLLVSGFDSINISLDSMNEGSFRKITHGKHFQSILRGIDFALSLGFKSIKLNAVLMKNFNDNE